MKKWVQHISGQGEKWEVDEPKSFPLSWRVKSEPSAPIHYDLPRSEYVECLGPEIWVKANIGIRGSQSQFLYQQDKASELNFASVPAGFRWKEHMGGFIIEKREQ